ncbi:hypothetical protein SAMN05414139_03810 [Burkholderia sp. D7]|nr:hypothetical protein SAMN05414139_03810 [Burkholderia sp. D7]
MLAIAATGTAIFISMLAGWQRGGWLSERIVWCAISVVLVLCAHLMPALCREASTIVRWIAGVLWVACMIAVSCGHATFFLLSQQHAGERRADAIAVVAAPVAQAAPPGRSLTAIAAEQATVRADLGIVTGQRCTRSCAILHANRIALSAKLDALNVEADEAKRWERAEDRKVVQADRVTTLRDAARDDPVTVRMAAWIGMTAGRANLLVALAFAAVIEGMACLCWYVALRPCALLATVGNPSVTSVVAPPVIDIDTGSHASASCSHATAHEPAASTPQVFQTEHDEKLLQLSRDVAAGRVRATVSDIRRHLGCSQARATGLRRQIGELQASLKPTRPPLGVNRVRNGAGPSRT